MREARGASCGSPGPIRPSSKSVAPYHRPQRGHPPFRQFRTSALGRHAHEGAGPRTRPPPNVPKRNIWLVTLKRAVATIRKWIALADLVAQAIAVTLQGVILATFVVVATTFVTFRRMNKDVRRARMFILAERLERFLAAFTVAFLFLTAALIANATGHPLPAAASTVIVFVWLGGFLYGAIEIFSVVAVMRLGASEMNLLCFFSKSANIGLVKIEMRHVGARLAEMLGLGMSPASGIEELFVMTKGGILLRHYSSTLRTDIDRDILSGMLVAVQAFVKQTLATKQGGLDELRYGAYTILFVRGTETVAAAVVRGAGSEDMKYPIMDALLAFESRFARELGSWTGDTSAFPGIDDYFSKILHT